MNKEKSKFPMFLLIFYIIIIFVMIFFIYILYGNNQTLNNSITELNDKISALENDKTESNSSTDTVEEVNLETLDTNNILVKTLYKYVLQSDNFDYSFAWSQSVEPASFYKKDKVTYSNLSDIEKTLVVLKNYPHDEIKTAFKSDLKNIINISDIADNVKVYKNISQKANDIFNSNDTNWKDYVGCSGRLTFKDDTYYLSEFEGGGKGTSEFGYAKIQKAEKDENCIYIYDKFIYIDSINYDLSQNDSKIHIYTTSDKLDDIGTESESISNSDDVLENYYNTYESKLKTFKHTFKQTGTGNYYWLSSEICD